MRRQWPVLLLALSPLCREPSLQLSTDQIRQGKPVELAHDQVLTGIFPKGESRIVVRLTLGEPQMLRAELAAAEGSDTRIAVFQNSDRPLVVVDDRPEGVGEEVSPILLTAGEARIEISATTSTPGMLKFFYRRFRAPADVEREPNQTPATATPMPGLHASGFYGPDKNLADGESSPERDCYVHTPPTSAGFLDVRLTAVDGIQPSLFVYGGKPAAPLAVRTGVYGKVLQIAGVKISQQEKIYLCVTGTRQSETVSRDYYDLILEFSAHQNRNEIEPNDSAKAATEITQGVITGALSSRNDVDYFAYLNQREYSVLVRIALESAAAAQLRLVLQQRNGLTRNFEYSAPNSEVIENARLEAGESLIFSVQPRRAAKKTLKAAAYEIKVSESQFSDENEAEPNGQVETADTLIDATYKWGFINPPQDVDYYRLQLTENVRRQLRLESKLGCKLSLEHLRAGKIVKVTRGKAPLVYEADFASDDLLRITCVDLFTQPAERAYRIALSEP